MNAPPLILASASPRRAELLERVGYTFTIRPADVDESVIHGEAAPDYAARVTAAKAVAVWEPGVVVVAADTCVVAPDGQILGKPTDAVDALRMLRSLSGATHSVLSAVRVIGPDGRQLDVVASALVRLAPADPEVLAGYVAGGEPMDKAGAYGIQGRAGMFVEHLAGSYTGVMGLPLFETTQLLRRFAYPL